jgi:hypothetical protein
MSVNHEPIRNCLVLVVLTGMVVGKAGNSLFLGHAGAKKRMLRWVRSMRPCRVCPGWRYWIDASVLMARARSRKELFVDVVRSGRRLST